MALAFGHAASWMVGESQLTDPRWVLLGLAVAAVLGGLLGWYTRSFSEKVRHQAQEAYEAEVVKAARQARERAGKTKKELEERLVRIHEEHSSCEGKIGALEQQLRELTEARDGLETDLAVARENGKGDPGRVARFETRIRELEAEVRQARDDVEQARKVAASAPEGKSDNGRDGVPPELMTSTNGDRDDLQAIRGLGPILEKRLNALGVRQYRQLARITPETAGWIAPRINCLQGRILRDKWAGQARRLHYRKYHEQI